VNELDDQWAWSQVEAMADGTLPHADAKRMRVAMGADAGLREAVERAAALRERLRRLDRNRVPSSLLRRLLAIPRNSRRVGSRRLTGLGAAAALGVAAASAAAVVIFLDPMHTGPRVPVGEQAEAAADFAVAMTYLQRSATLARTETAAAVGTGLRDAFAVSRDAMRGEQPQPNGD
jgi:hypothetical protein